MTRSLLFNLFVGFCLAFTLGSTLVLTYGWYRTLSPGVTLVAPQVSGEDSNAPDAESQLGIISNIDTELSELRSVLVAHKQFEQLNGQFVALITSRIHREARDKGDLTDEDYHTFLRLLHRLRPILIPKMGGNPDILARITTRFHQLSEALYETQRFAELPHALPYQQWQEFYDQPRRIVAAVLSIIDPTRSQPGRTLAQRIDDEPVLRNLNVSVDYLTFPDWLRPDRQGMKLSDDPELDAKLEAWYPVARSFGLHDGHVHAGLVLAVDPTDMEAIVNGSEFKDAGLDLGAWLLHRCAKEKGFTPFTIRKPIYVNQLIPRRKPPALPG